MSRDLRVATAQPQISGDLSHNLQQHISLAHEAKQDKADIIHFPESSLTGYPTVDFSDFTNFPQQQLDDALATLQQEAASLGIWMIVGGHHYRDGFPKPTNCLWVLNDRGNIECRYDKRICAGNPGELEHAHYQPGLMVVTFQLKGIPCGLLICHEWRYPELYREQQRLGTEVLFHSFYDRIVDANEYLEQGEEQGSLVQGTVRGNAANNYFWISASNTGQPESNFGSFLVRPDGKIHAQAQRNEASVLVNTIDLSAVYSDPSKPWRERAREGVLHSMTL